MVHTSLVARYFSVVVVRSISSYGMRGWKGKTQGSKVRSGSRILTTSHASPGPGTARFSARDIVMRSPMSKGLRTAINIIPSTLRAHVAEKANVKDSNIVEHDTSKGHMSKPSRDRTMMARIP